MFLTLGQTHWFLRAPSSSTWYITGLLLTVLHRLEKNSGLKARMPMPVAQRRNIRDTEG
jgi:hypothetical protein